VTSYLLDTSVIIEWLKNSPGAEDILLGLAEGGDRLAVCCVSVSEVCAGLHEREQDVFESLLTGMDYWDITPAAARRAGQIRFDWARRGRQISTPDALQAALAMERDEFFVTTNVKDFPMADLKLVPFRH
jgi:predicted nucleic acid-binding protein